MIFLFLFLLIIVVAVAASCVKIVPQARAYVVEFLGAYKTTWQTGLYFKIPFFERVAKNVTLKEQVIDFPPQPVITKDNVTMQIDTVIFFQVTDPKLFTYGVENPIIAIENLTSTTLRNIIGDMELDETLTSRETINSKMVMTLDEATDPWGIKVNRVELKNIMPPAAIQESMEKQMKAERERRESILIAEGEKKSTVLVAEGKKESAILEAEAEKQAAILKAEAEREKMIKEAEGEAEAILKVQRANAEGIRMLKEAGVDYVIVGHSERRQYFGEDDECINRKVRKAIEYGLTPIICCGETIQQREEGITLDFINKQIDAAFLQVSAKDAMKCVIAYEPIWAIGTGRVATSAQAQEVCEAIRLDIRKLYGEEAASSIRILYGGSVNAGNAAELFRQPDIDGGLVGGASLKPDFCEIVNYNI